MKKISFLSVILLWNAISINAQEITMLPQVPRSPHVWFDFQIAQSFGLNDWHRIKFASDRLPGTSFSTDLRATFNTHIVRPVGLFTDIGLGIMPAPRDGFADPAAYATLSSGIPFFTKETTLDHGNQTATAHFKMTFGVFARVPMGEKLSVSPYFGVGFMTVQAPNCDVILKEQETNMQYKANYCWFKQDEYNNPTIGYLAGRLRFSYHLASKRYLLVGFEYHWYFTRASFSETYTNYFNYNIVTTNYYEGNRLIMLGLSLGVSF